MADDLKKSMNLKATDFFVEILQKMPEGKHHLKLFEDLLKSDNADIKNYFQKFNDSQKYQFFKIANEVFRISAGYISLRSLPEVKDNFLGQKCVKTEMKPFSEIAVANEKTVICLMRNHLVMQNSSIHFEKLCSISKHSQEFFQKFSVSEKYKFFKERSMYFALACDGYVHLPDVRDISETSISGKPKTNSKVHAGTETNVKNEKKVIDMMREHLVPSRSIHFEKLCLVSNCTKLFFQHFSLSEKYDFFKQSQYFKVTSDGYVHLPGIVANTEATGLTEDVENSLESLFIKVIKKKSQKNTKKMSYKAVKPIAIAFSEKLKPFLEKLSHEDIYQFLKARPQYFVWESDRHVSLSVEVLNNSNSYRKKLKHIQTSENTLTNTNVINLSSDPTANVEKLTVTPVKQVPQKEPTTLRLNNVSTRFTASTSIGIVPSEFKKKALDTWRVAKNSGINDNARKEERWKREVETDSGRSSSCDCDAKSVDSFSAVTSVQSVSEHSDSKSENSIHTEPSLSPSSSSSSSSSCKVAENSSDIDDVWRKCPEKQLMQNTIINVASKPDNWCIAPCSDTTNVNSYNENRISQNNLKVNCEQNLPDEIRNKITDYFINVLINQGRRNSMHYEELASYINDSPDDVRLAFDNYTQYDMLHFFSKAEQFSVDNNGCVSINIAFEEMRHAENEVVCYLKDRIYDSLQPCHYKLLFSALQDSEIYKKPNISRAFSCYMPDKYKMFFKKYPECFSVDSNGFVTLCSEANLEKDSEKHEEMKNYAFESNESLLSATDKLESEEKTQSDFVFCLTGMHITAVRYFIDILKVRKSLHYKELLKTVCDDDQHVSVFFSNFVSIDVLKFFHIHSNYFSCDHEGMITLKDATVLTCKVLTTYQEIMEVVQKIESEAIKFFICTLKDETKVSIFQLECFLGSASGYIISHFSANYCGTNIMKFFLNHSEYFDVNDKCVNLTSKALNGNFVSVIDTGQSSNIGTAQDTHGQNSIVENYVTDRGESSSKYFEDSEKQLCDDCSLIDKSTNVGNSHSECATNEALSTLSAEESFPELRSLCTHESVAETCSILNKSEVEAPETFSISTETEKNPSMQQKKFSFREENSSVELQHNSRNLTTSAKKENNYNNSSHVSLESSKSNNADSIPCGTSHSPTASENDFTVPKGEIAQIISLLCNISVELKSIRQTLNSVITSPDMLNLGNHNSSPHQKLILKSKLKLVGTFFNPEMERKSINFFCKILLNEMFPVSLASLQLRILEATSDVKMYLSKCYLSDLALFFYMHLEYFNVDQHDRISLRAGTCAKSTVKYVCDGDVVNDKNIKIKAINFFIVILSGFSWAIPGTKLKTYLPSASEEVQQYFLHKYDKNFLHFFTENSKYFQTDEMGRITLRKN